MRPDPGETAARRVLIVSYYFPPSGGPGVQRTLKFVRYLPGSGWSPTVVTVRPDRAAWPAVDASMLAEIPAGTPVVRTGSWDPYAAYARLTGRRKSESVGVGFVDDRPPDGRERLARWIRANGNKKPVIGFIAGQTAPKGRKMGHAGAIVGSADDTAAAKMRILAENGITVVQSPAQIGATVRKIMGK